MSSVTLAGRPDEPFIFVSQESRLESSKFPDFELQGAELTTLTGRGLDKFVIQLRHADATDFEHDSAAVAYFEGAGLKFQSMQYGEALFYGLLTKGRWYPDGMTFEEGQHFDHDSETSEAYLCDREHCEPHLMLPYMPPKHRISPQEVSIRVSYRNFMESEPTDG